MVSIDQLCYRSRLRHMNACEKAAYTIMTLCVCIISRSVLIGLIVLFLNAILNIKKGGISAHRYLRLMEIPLAFLLLSTLTILVNVSETPLDAYAVPIGKVYLTGSWAGLFMGVQLIITALASVSCLYFLSLNTTMTDILGVLKKIHCPELLMELMMLIYRYIFVLMRTASSILTAQQSRLSGCNQKTALHAFGMMGANLFILSLKRANALYDAMESRCYDGKIMVLSEESPAKKEEVISIILFEILLVGIWMVQLFV